MIDKINRLKAEIDALKASKADEIEALRIKYLSKKGEQAVFHKVLQDVCHENLFG
mgnify:CR=1 FL=1